MRAASLAASPGTRGTWTTTRRDCLRRNVRRYAVPAAAPSSPQAIKPGQRDVGLSDSQSLLQNLAIEAQEHFISDDIDALFGTDTAVANWDDPRAVDPEFFTEIVQRASGLDAANREAADNAKDNGRRAKKSDPVDRAVSAARGRAATMFNLVLSALEMRRGAHEVALDILFKHIPEVGVTPDIVSHALVAKACASAGDETGAGDALAAARNAAGVKPSTAAPTDTPDPNPTPLHIIYEDTCMACVSKPAGVLTHDAGKSKKKEKNLVDYLLDMYGETGLSSVNRDGRGIVHRLDKPTTGCVVVAKDDLTHLQLVAAWYQRTVKKKYVTLVEGHPDDVNARKEKRNRQNRGTVIFPVDGKPAKSTWMVVEYFDGKNPLSLVEVAPYTGRKHQVRVHMGLACGAPLVNDPLYRKGKPAKVPKTLETFFAKSGDKKAKKKKPGAELFLHAQSVELDHPATGEPLELSDPLPTAFAEVVELLRKESK